MDTEPDLTLRLIDQLHKQREKGIAKYKTPVLSGQSVAFWLRHSIEEKVDDLNYSYAALDAVELLLKRVEELESRIEDMQEDYQLGRQERLRRAMKEDVDTLHRIIKQQVEEK